MSRAPSRPAKCTLAAGELSVQAERYRRAGAGATIERRSASELVVRLPDAVDRDLVDELVAIERECCPFLRVTWDRGPAHLDFAVVAPADEPALDAIEWALAQGGPAPPAAAAG